MKRLLVDVNVILDVLLDRASHAAHAAALWTAIEQKRVEGVLPAHGFTTIFYLVAKRHGRDTAARAMTDLLSVFGVAAVDEAILRRAAALGFDDFEDAVAAAAGEAAGCDAVVTRDPKGFAGGPLDAIEPALAVAALTDEVQEASEEYPAGQRRVARRRRLTAPSGR